MQHSYDKQALVRRELANYHAKVKMTNKLYSTRSFARKLGISISTYSEFMSGKRLMSEELLRKILEKLSVETPIISEFETLPLKSSKIFKHVDCSDKITQDSFEHSTTIYSNIVKCSSTDHSKKFVIHVDEETEKKLHDCLHALEEKIASLLDGQNLKSKKELRTLELNVKSPLEKQSSTLS